MFHVFFLIKQYFHGLTILHYNAIYSELLYATFSSSDGGEGYYKMSRDCPILRVFSLVSSHLLIKCFH